LVKGAANVDTTLLGAGARGAFTGAVEQSRNRGCVATVIAYAPAKAALAAAKEINFNAQQQMRETLATQIDDLEVMLP
jgi:hypothetical protein